MMYDRHSVEKIIEKLFTDEYTDSEKKHALAEAERYGWLSEILLRYHPEYILPDGTASSFRLAQKMGWI